MRHSGLLQNERDWKWKQQLIFWAVAAPAPKSLFQHSSLLVYQRTQTSLFPILGPNVNLSPMFLKAVLVWTRKSVGLRFLLKVGYFCFGFLFSVVGFLFPVLESVAPQISWISRVGLFSGGRTLATRRLYCQSIWDFKIGILQKSKKQQFESQYFDATMFKYQDKAHADKPGKNLSNDLWRKSAMCNRIKICSI